MENRSFYSIGTGSNSAMYCLYVHEFVCVYGPTEGQFFRVYVKNLSRNLETAKAKARAIIEADSRLVINTDGEFDDYQPQRAISEPIG